MIYTMGYTGRKLTTLIEVLDHYKRCALVDIRFAARSQSPVWQKRNLDELLPGNYIHLQDWGNVNYKSDGPIAIANFSGGLEVFQSYQRHFDNFVLMCACRVEESCHRAHVARMLRQFDYQVQELDWSVVETGPKQDVLF